MEDDYIERTKRAWEEREKLIERQPKEEEPKPHDDGAVVRSPTHVCLGCGQAVFPGADTLVGKRVMTIVLGVLTLGIYFLIRMARKPECPLCGSRRLVPKTSPEAQQVQNKPPAS